MLILELSIQGLIQGAIYALIALGLTLVYGLLRILHVAHAALFTLGAYIGVIITNETGSIVLAIVLSMIIIGFLGIGVYRLAYKPLLNKPPLVALIASIGIFIAAEEVYRVIFGAYGMSFTNPPLQHQIEFHIWDLSFTSPYPRTDPVHSSNCFLRLARGLNSHRRCLACNCFGRRDGGKFWNQN